MTAALIPVDSSSPDFAQMVEAFAARDFVTSARLAGDFVYQGGPVQGIQLGLISLRRVGAEGEAMRLAEAVIDRIQPADPWSAGLVGLVVGRRTAGQLIAEARNQTETCQIHFYAGAADAIDGRKADAIRQFDLCLRSGAPCLELYLAEVERASLSG